MRRKVHLRTEYWNDCGRPVCGIRAKKRRGRYDEIKISMDSHAVTCGNCQRIRWHQWDKLQARRAMEGACNEQLFCGSMRSRVD